MGKTKEERFILRIYEVAKSTGDPSATLDRYAIGSQLGIHPKGVDTICRILAQANFIKIVGKTEIKLSPNGLELVKNLTG